MMVLSMCIGVGCRVDVFRQVGETVSDGCDVDVGQNDGNTVLCRRGLIDIDVIVEDVYTAIL
jgi:hypothetical protein